MARNYGLTHNLEQEIAMISKCDVYYFGCIGVIGHYLFDGDCQTVHYGLKHNFPWEMIDGRLAPAVRERNSVRKESPQGHAALHYKNGWTAIAFWDRSIDHRSGCNSNFFIRGIHSWEDALDIARSQFPDIWKRFDFEVILAETPSRIESKEIMTMQQKAAASDRFRDVITSLEHRIAVLESTITELRNARS